MSSKIFDAMGLVQEYNKKHGVAQRGGKTYTQVVHRMEAFRQVFGMEFGVDTTIVVDDGQRVVIRAIITNGEGLTIGSGHAEEIRGDGHVNKTSAIENCETSAIGRALSSIGLSGGEYASANEMDAVGRKQQNLSNQVGGGRADPSAADAPPPDPSPEDKQKRKDKLLYLDIANTLPSKKSRQSVEQFFLDNKPAIKELRDRDAGKADLIMKLFEDRIKELGV